MFAALFFIANLVLMLHVIPMSRFTIVCDRYLYVALLGPGAFVGWWTAYGLKKYRKLTLSLIIPYFLYLGVYTFIYQGRWESSSELKKEVRWKGHLPLQGLKGEGGHILIRTGQNDNRTFLKLWKWGNVGILSQLCEKVERLCCNFKFVS